MQVFFIINEYAGNGRGALIWGKLKKRLNFSYTAIKTEYAKHAEQIVSEIADSTKQSCLIIGIGGDGTLSEIIAGAIGYSHIAISAIKAGSGNDFAKGYHVFKGAKELNAYIAQNQLDLKRMDVGHIQSATINTTFVNNAGFGFDALVATTVNKSRLKSVLNKVGLGRLAYVLFTIKLLFSFKTFTVEATIDDKRFIFDKVWFVALCNQPYFGGGMKISPRSKMDDQKLEFVIVQFLSPIKLLLLFLTVFTGKHERFKEITFIKASFVEMEFSDNIVSHADGDLFKPIQPGERIAISMPIQNWGLAKVKS